MSDTNFLNLTDAYCTASIERCGENSKTLVCFRMVYWTAVFMFSYRGAYHFFRAHPDNDGKGVWFDDSEAKFEPMAGDDEEERRSPRSEAEDFPSI